ncbi:Solute carrier family 35 member F5 [Eumeta japonica]|uniref:Solute carrier family 35 member F5 n=1 Tax=Eumeta variegata TaxID=151549 RepID=A0A4C1T150_EUMVA|nr:Solute carrier family 35 member F5 [Eumeta japonica]
MNSERTVGVRGISKELILYDLESMECLWGGMSEDERRECHRPFYTHFVNTALNAHLIANTIEIRCLFGFERFKQSLNFSEKDGRQVVFGFEGRFVPDPIPRCDYIYVEKKLERPFLLTYVRSSLLLMYLLVLCFSPPTRDPCRSTPDYTGDSTFVPVRAGETTDSDDAAPRAVRFNKVAEVRVMSAAQASEALLARLSWAASVRASEHAQRRAAAAATRRHLRLALLYAIPWFTSNYLYRLSILHASASSATVYASTASAFTLCAGAVCAHAPHDRFGLAKCLSVLLTAAGLVSIGTSDSHQSNWTAVLSALGAAVCYATHLVLLRRELNKGEGINAPLLTGLVGCACAAGGWAAGGALSATGLEHADMPNPSMWPWLLVDAALGPLILEALWLWGCSLTSSRTATAFLALVLPLSVCSEAWLGVPGSGTGGAGRWCGAALAAGGWLTAMAEDVHLWKSVNWLRARIYNVDGFTALRNMPDLDEQSEALMSSEEPT